MDGTFIVQKVSKTEKINNLKKSYFIGELLLGFDVKMVELWYLGLETGYRFVQKIKIDNSNIELDFSGIPYSISLNYRL